MKKLGMNRQILSCRNTCLDIVREGGLNDGSADAFQGVSQRFDTAGNLRLVPKFL